MFAICDMHGESTLSVEAVLTLDDAVLAAVKMLEDDPEMSELTVWEVDRTGALLTHHRTITFGPDTRWNSVVVVLRPGEHVRPPGPVPHRIGEEDLEGYELGSSKRIALEQRLGEWTI